MPKLTSALFPIFIVSHFITSASALAGSSPPVLFASDEVIEMSLQADFSKLLWREIRKGEITPRSELPPVSGILRYQDQGREVVVPVALSPRGRNRFFECPMLPPLKIAFEDADLQETVFAGFESSKLKLTTPCFYSENLADPALGKLDVRTEYVLKEYALYKAIESLGLPAFRTRLVRLTYRNSEGRAFMTAYSFFIEPSKQLARRYGCYYVNIKDRPYFNRRKLSAEQLLSYELQRAVFQEDADHSLNTDHDPGSLWPEIANNNGLLYLGDSDRLFATVSYDFDWSYLVESPLNLNLKFEKAAVKRARQLQEFGSALAEASWSTRFKFASNYFSRKDVVLRRLSKVPLRDRAEIFKNLELIFGMLEKYAVGVNPLFNPKSDDR